MSTVTFDSPQFSFYLPALCSALLCKIAIRLTADDKLLLLLLLLLPMLGFRLFLSFLEQLVPTTTAKENGRDQAKVSKLSAWLLGRLVDWEPAKSER